MLKREMSWKFRTATMITLWLIGFSGAVAQSSSSCVSEYYKEEGVAGSYKWQADYKEWLVSEIKSNISDGYKRVDINLLISNTRGILILTPASMSDIGVARFELDSGPITCKGSNLDKDDQLGFRWVFNCLAGSDLRLDEPTIEKFKNSRKVRMLLIDSKGQTIRDAQFNTFRDAISKATDAYSRITKRPRCPVMPQDDRTKCFPFC